MSNHERISDIESGNLFRDQAIGQRSLDLDSAIRKGLADLFRESSKSRQIIAEDMSRLMGREITVAVLDTFTAETKTGHRFPAAWLAALTVATGDTRVLKTIVEFSGLRMITDEEAMLIELARAYLVQKHSAEKMAAMEHKLERGGKR